MLDAATLPKVDGRDINLLIATPCYGAMTYVTHNRSLRGLIDLLRQHQVRHVITETLTESLIPRARNAFANICAWDLDQSGQHYTHLLFLDVDIGFNPINILQALGWKHPITALPYPCKTILWPHIVTAVKRGVEDPTALSRMGSRPIVNTDTPIGNFRVDEPVQFPQLGTGILLIEREVFLKMATPERRYRLMDGEKCYGTRDYAYDYFQIGINPRTRYYDSEDYRFCLDARELGYETWLLPWAVTSHTGMMDFWMDIPAQATVGIPEPAETKYQQGFVPLTI